MAFVQRQITLTIQLGEGNFGDAGLSNTATLEGLWCDVALTKSNLPAGDQVDVRVLGVSQTIANAISRLGKPQSYVRKNILTVSAGDSVSGMAVLFQGIFQGCYQDFAQLPEVALIMTCASGVNPGIAPAPAFTYSGDIDVARIAQTLCLQLGYAFQNNGVSFIVSNPYYSGDLVEQLRKTQEAGRYYAAIMTNTGTPVYTMWPRGGSVTTPNNPTIEPPNLVGYPAFSDTGCLIKSLYVPNMVIGGIFNLKTSIPNVSGQWQVSTLKYDLSTRPDGPWFMTVDSRLYIPGVPQ